MPLKKFNPTSPGVRFRTEVVTTTSTTNAPHKPLLEKKNRTGGRDNRGDDEGESHGVSPGWALMFDKHAARSQGGSVRRRQSQDGL